MRIIEKGQISGEESQSITDSNQQESGEISKVSESSSHAQDHQDQAGEQGSNDSNNANKTDPLTKVLLLSPRTVLPMASISSAPGKNVSATTRPLSLVNLGTINQVPFFFDGTSIYSKLDSELRFVKTLPAFYSPTFKGRIGNSLIFASSQSMNPFAFIIFDGTETRIETVPLPDSDQRFIFLHNEKFAFWSKSPTSIISDPEMLNRSNVFNILENGVWISRPVGVSIPLQLPVDLKGDNHLIISSRGEPSSRSTLKDSTSPSIPPPAVSSFLRLSFDEGVTWKRFDFQDSQIPRRITSSDHRIIMTTKTHVSVTKDLVQFEQKELPAPVSKIAAEKNGEAWRVLSEIKENWLYTRYYSETEDTWAYELGTGKDWINLTQNIEGCDSISISESGGLYPSGLIFDAAQMKCLQPFNDLPIIQDFGTLSASEDSKFRWVKRLPDNENFTLEVLLPGTDIYESTGVSVLSKNNYYNPPLPLKDPQTNSYFFLTIQRKADLRTTQYFTSTDSGKTWEILTEQVNSQSESEVRIHQTEHDLILTKQSTPANAVPTSRRVDGNGSSQNAKVDGSAGSLSSASIPAAATTATVVNNESQWLVSSDRGKTWNPIFTDSQIKQKINEDWVVEPCYRGKGEFLLIARPRGNNIGKKSWYALTNDFGKTITKISEIASSTPVGGSIRCTAAAAIVLNNDSSSQALSASISRKIFKLDLQKDEWVLAASIDPQIASDIYSQSMQSFISPNMKNILVIAPSRARAPEYYFSADGGETFSRTGDDVAQCAAHSFGIASSAGILFQRTGFGCFAKWEEIATTAIK